MAIIASIAPATAPQRPDFISSIAISVFGTYDFSDPEQNLNVQKLYD